MHVVHTLLFSSEQDDELGMAACLLYTHCSDCACHQSHPLKALLRCHNIAYNCPSPCLPKQPGIKTSTSAPCTNTSGTSAMLSTISTGYCPNKRCSAAHHPAQLTLCSLALSLRSWQAGDSTTANTSPETATGRQQLQSLGSSTHTLHTQPGRRCCTCPGVETLPPSSRLLLIVCALASVAPTASVQAIIC